MSTEFDYNIIIATLQRMIDEPEHYAERKTLGADTAGRIGYACLKKHKDRVGADDHEVNSFGYLARNTTANLFMGGVVKSAFEKAIKAVEIEKRMEA